MKFFAPTLIALTTVPAFTEAYNVGGSRSIGPFSVVTSSRLSEEGTCRPSTSSTGGGSRRRRSRIGPPDGFGLMTSADIQAMRQFGKEVFQQTAAARDDSCRGDQQYSYSPAYQIVNDETQFQVKLDVPGVKMEDLNINLEEDGKVLTLSGSREKVLAGGAADGTSSSYSSKFSQGFALNGEPTIDTDQFVANLRNGVLTVSAPKNVQIVKDTVQSIPITELDVDNKKVMNIRQPDELVAGESRVPDADTAEESNEQDKDDPTDDEAAAA
mmetsp:Transcript_29198/g.48243  ORF Transcript_29198/g.48243 Transcript_29198/m.48243 type:complete len:270 (+) Transcript_29198:70-879(+)|eukprot:CAMPEP_0119014532 /NCGR_PEP_ID=MMETSP1176-20130426/9905_1 /TAXON_ID=265551 /ORGANISM="Synedropsis recta cf, Strain CCMP1620" /LENGTH=269 /DNA_ID=CAMNT_0006967723 /DNA_START=46 /DNA_END=855 /DNA_ORIENTATION=+